MVVLWWFYGDSDTHSMVILLYGDSMVILYSFYGDSMVMSIASIFSVGTFPGGGHKRDPPFARKISDLLRLDQQFSLVQNTS